MLAAINKVESNFGRNMGPSSAGAIGWMQFMPDTWLRWGTDANGDGVADPWNPDDAIFSAARYLAAAGGTTDLYRAVYAYNHADWYVKEVLDLANLYGSNSGVAFSLDRLQVSLDTARSAVVAASERLIAAHEALGVLDKEVARRQARAARAPLLSDRLELEARAGRVAARRDAASALVDQQAQAPGGRAQPGAGPRGAGVRGVFLRAWGLPAPGGAVVFLGLRLPGRRRPRRRLRLAHPPRLPGRRHRRADGLAALRARGLGRRALLEHSRIRAAASA